MKTTFNFFVIALFLNSFIGFGQGLTVNIGTSLTVLSGTNFYVNGLGLIPNNDLTFTGSTEISKTSTPVGGSIDRVFNISNPILDFEGNLTFFYEESELLATSANENELMLRLKNGTTWSADIETLRNSGSNTLTYNINSPTTFSAITASKPGVTLSINELNKLAIEVYPNPAISNLIIKTELATETTIYSTLGQVLLKTNIKNIDVSPFKTGTYLMVVRDIDSNNTNTYQVIKI